jgi:hypothetical protein
MGRLILFCVAVAGLVAASGEAGAGCCACARVRAGPWGVAAALYGYRVVYAPAGVSPCFVRAVAEAFPPPPARVVFDLRSSVISVRDPWSGAW